MALLVECKLEEDDGFDRCLLSTESICVLVIGDCFLDSLDLQLTRVLNERSLLPSDVEREKHKK